MNKQDNVQDPMAPTTVLTKMSVSQNLNTNVTAAGVLKETIIQQSSCWLKMVAILSCIILISFLEFLPLLAATTYHLSKPRITIQFFDIYVCHTTEIPMDFSITILITICTLIYRTNLVNIWPLSCIQVTSWDYGIKHNLLSMGINVGWERSHYYIVLTQKLNKPHISISIHKHQAIHSTLNYCDGVCDVRS